MAFCPWFKNNIECENPRISIESKINMLKEVCFKGCIKKIKEKENSEEKKNVPTTCSGEYMSIL